MRSPAEMLTTFDLSRVAWVGRSDVRFVRDHENVVAWVLDLVLHDWTIETLWNWRKLISVEVADIMLLANMLLRSSLNFLASVVCLLINDIRVECRVANRCHEMLHVLLRNL